MDSPATAPQTRVTAVPSDRPNTIARPAVAERPTPIVVIRECLVCGQEFSATRATARCCSGRCRIILSRARRVAELVQRLALAEAELRAAESAIKEAAIAVHDLRALAEQGGPKVAP
jgi:predicted nucleic acid-binding Zn ribbon protein